MGITTTLLIIDTGYRKTGVYIRVPDFIDWMKPVIKIKPMVSSEYDARHNDRSVVLGGTLKGKAALMAMFDVGPETSDGEIKMAAQDCIDGITERLEAFAQGEDMRNDVDRMMDKVAEKASQHFDVDPKKVLA